MPVATFSSSPIRKPLPQLVNTTLSKPIVPHISSGNTIVTPSTTTPTYFVIGSSGRMQNSTSIETDIQTPYFAPGTIRKFSAYVSVNNLTVSTTIRLRKNGLNANSVLTIPAGGTGLFEDNVNVDTVGNNVPDFFCVEMLSPDNTANNTLSMTILSFDFEPTDNIAVTRLVGRGRNTHATASATRYGNFVGGITTNSTEGLSRIRMGKSGRFRKFAVFISANPRTTDTIVRLRVNAIDTSIMVTIPAGVSGWFYDTVDEERVDIGDQVGLGVTTGAGTEGIQFEINSMEFVSDDRFSTMIYSTTPTGNTTVNGLSTLYAPISGNANSFSESGAVNIRSKIRNKSIFSNLEILITTATIDGTVTVRFLKNGANGNQVISVPPNTSGRFVDDSYTDIIDANDLVEYTVHNSSTTTTNSVQLRSIQSYVFNSQEVITLRNLVVSFIDSITLSHTNTRQRALIQTSSESLSFADTTNKYRKLDQNITYSLALSDTINKYRRRSAEFADSISISHDNIERIKGKLKSFIEPLALTDTYVRKTERLRAFVDSIGLTDSHTRIRSLLNTVTEQLGLTEIVSRLRNKNRNYSDNISLTHDNSKIRYLIQLMSDTLTLSDTRTRSRNKIRTVEQPLSIVDSSTRTRGMIGTIDELLQFQKTITQAREGIKSIIHTLQFTKTVTKNKEVLRTINQPLALTDTHSKFKERIRQVSETLTLTHDTQKFRLLLQTITETLNLTHTHMGTINRIRSFANSLSLSHTNNRYRGKPRTRTESISFTHTLPTRVKGILRGFTDSLQLFAYHPIRTRIGEVSFVESLTLVADFVKSKPVAAKTFVETLGFTSNHIAEKYRSFFVRLFRLQSNK